MGIGWLQTREVLLKRRLSIADLFALTSLISSFHIESIFNLFYKTDHLNEEVNCTEPSLQLVFPV